MCRESGFGGGERADLQAVVAPRHTGESLRHRQRGDEAVVLGPAGAHHAGDSHHLGAASATQREALSGAQAQHAGGALAEEGVLRRVVAWPRALDVPPRGQSPHAGSRETTDGRHRVREPGAGDCEPLPTPGGCRNAERRRVGEHVVRPEERREPRQFRLVEQQGRPRRRRTAAERLHQCGARRCDVEIGAESPEFARHLVADVERDREQRRRQGYAERDADDRQRLAPPASRDRCGEQGGEHYGFTK